MSFNSNNVRFIRNVTIINNIPPLPTTTLCQEGNPFPLTLLFFQNTSKQPITTVRLNDSNGNQYVVPDLFVWEPGQFISINFSGQPILPNGNLSLYAGYTSDDEEIYYDFTINCINQNGLIYFEYLFDTEWDPISVCTSISTSPAVTLFPEESYNFTYQIPSKEVPYCDLSGNFSGVDTETCFDTSHCIFSGIDASAFPTSFCLLNNTDSYVTKNNFNQLNSDFDYVQDDYSIKINYVYVSDTLNNVYLEIDSDSSNDTQQSYFLNGAKNTQTTPISFKPGDAIELKNITILPGNYIQIYLRDDYDQGYYITIHNRNNVMVMTYNGDSFGIDPSTFLIMGPNTVVKPNVENYTSSLFTVDPLPIIKTPSVMITVVPTTIECGIYPKSTINTNTCSIGESAFISSCVTSKLFRDSTGYGAEINVLNPYHYKGKWGAIASISLSGSIASGVTTIANGKSYPLSCILKTISSKSVPNTLPDSTAPDAFGSTSYKLYFPDLEPIGQNSKFMSGYKGTTNTYEPYRLSIPITITSKIGTIQVQPTIFVLTPVLLMTKDYFSTTITPSYDSMTGIITGRINITTNSSVISAQNSTIQTSPASITVTYGSALNSSGTIIKVVPSTSSSKLLQITDNNNLSYTVSNLQSNVDNCNTTFSYTMNQTTISNSVPISITVSPPTSCPITITGVTQITSTTTGTISFTGVLSGSTTTNGITTRYDMLAIVTGTTKIVPITSNKTLDWTKMPTSTSITIYPIAYNVAGKLLGPPYVFTICPAGYYCPTTSSKIICSNGTYSIGNATSSLQCTSGNVLTLTQTQIAGITDSTVLSTILPTLTATQITYLTVVQIPTLTSSQIKTIAVTSIPKLKVEQLGAMKPIQFSYFTKNQIQALIQSQYSNLSLDQLQNCYRNMTYGQLFNLSVEMKKKLILVPEGVICPAGKYCPVINSYGSVISCPAGNYCGVNVSSPTPCPAGNYCGVNVSSPTPCPAGNYCPSGSTTQTPCPAGSFCSDPTQSNVCQTGSYCPSGSTTQVPCSAGSYCPTPTQSSLCQAGSYCPSGSTTQTPCPLGSFCPAGSSIDNPCRSGYYCPDSHTITTCPPNSFNYITGQTSLSSCIYAPTNVVASSGDRSVTITFDTLNTNPNVKYVATYGNIKTDPVTSSPITVTGLTNGTSYTFTVTAIVTIGTDSTSVPSNLSNTVTPATVPDAPTITSITSFNSTAKINFGYENNGGSPITSYTATDGNGHTATGTSSPIIVTGLTNGTLYTFTVTARNIIGSSISSNPESVTPNHCPSGTYPNDTSSTCTVCPAGSYCPILPFTIAYPTSTISHFTIINPYDYTDVTYIYPTGFNELQKGAFTISTTVPTGSYPITIKYKDTNGVAHSSTVTIQVRTYDDTTPGQHTVSNLPSIFYTVVAGAAGGDSAGLGGTGGTISATLTNLSSMIVLIATASGGGGTGFGIGSGGNGGYYTALLTDDGQNTPLVVGGGGGGGSAGGSYTSGSSQLNLGTNGNGWVSTIGGSGATVYTGGNGGYYTSGTGGTGGTKTNGTDGASGTGGGGGYGITGIGGTSNKGGGGGGAGLNGGGGGGAGLIGGGSSNNYGAGGGGAFGAGGGGSWFTSGGAGSSYIIPNSLHVKGFRFKATTSKKGSVMIITIMEKDVEKNIKNDKIQCPVGTYCPSGSILDSPCPIGSYCPTPSSILSCPIGYYCPGGLQPVQQLGTDDTTSFIMSDEMQLNLFQTNYQLTSICAQSFTVSSPITIQTITIQVNVQNIKTIRSEDPMYVSVAIHDYDYFSYTSSFFSPLATSTNNTITATGIFTITLSFPTPVLLTSNQYYMIIRPSNFKGMCVGSSRPFVDIDSNGTIIQERVVIGYNNITPGSLYFIIENAVQIRPQTCPLGTYCPIGSSSALPCPVGSYCPNSSTRTNCSPGYYCPTSNLTQEQLCPAGSYCLSGTITPSSCPIGSYCPSGSSTTMTCPTGFYCSTPDKKEICPAGSYCLSGTSIPTKCPIGTYCPSGSSTAMTCPVGFYCSTPDKKEICPAGSYCLSGTSSPSLCPIGSYCPSGTSNPSSCPTGTYCPDGSSTTMTCPKGFYCSTPSEKQICPMGTYCPSGSSTTMTCLSGFYCSTPSEQQPCPAGKYCPTGTSTPLSCPGGTYCTEGSSSPTQCPEGYYCPEGTTGITGITIPLLTNTNVTFVGKTEDYFTTSVNYTTNVDVLTSGAPSYITNGSSWTITNVSNIALAGMEINIANGSNGLALNYYEIPTIPVGESWTINWDIIQGVNLNITFNTNISPIRRLMTTIFYIDPNGNFRSQPSVVSRSNINMIITDSSVPSLLNLCSITATATDPQSARVCDNTVFCPAGSSVPTPVTCPKGFYCTTINNNTQTKTRCIPGTYCPPNSTSPTSCPTGYYCSDGRDKVECPVGTLCPSGSSSITHTSPGNYSINYINELICSYNTYSGTDASSCTPCAPGLYSDYGSATCSTCPQGSYCPSTPFTVSYPNVLTPYFTIMNPYGYNVSQYVYSSNIIDQGNGTFSISPDATSGPSTITITYQSGQVYTITLQVKVYDATTPNVNTGIIVSNLPSMFYAIVSGAAGKNATNPNTNPGRGPPNIGYGGLGGVINATLTGLSSIKVHIALGSGGLPGQDSYFQGGSGGDYSEITDTNINPILIGGGGGGGPRGAYIAGGSSYLTDTPNGNYAGSAGGDTIFNPGAAGSSYAAVTSPYILDQTFSNNPSTAGSVVVVYVEENNIKSCETGTYCPSGSISETICPTNTTFTSNPYSCVINPGYYSNSGTATICPIGSYCVGNNKSPVLCGSYGPNGFTDTNTCLHNGTVGFTYTGSNQYWTCPSTITSITVSVAGSQYGCLLNAKISVTPGTTYTIVVGGTDGKYAGSGYGNAGNGGGFSAIINSNTNSNGIPNTISDVFIISAGGNYAGTVIPGGYRNGIDGYDASSRTNKGASQTDGGIGYYIGGGTTIVVGGRDVRTGDTVIYCNGSLFQGASSSSIVNAKGMINFYGGGGGYYGGGISYVAVGNKDYYGYGGSASSYINNTYVTYINNSYNGQFGYISISY